MASPAVSILDRYAMGSVYALTSALPAPTDQGGSLDLRSEAVTRGTGCVNRTRPDLWGSRSGNLRLYPEKMVPSVGRCRAQYRGLFLHTARCYRT